MNKVLVVNDCKFEGMILNDMLSQIGYNVYITDEYKAMNNISSFSPDIVMVNYIMKDTRGDRLINLIKAKHPNIICILSSSNEIDTYKLNHNDIDAIVKTPINTHNLILTIKEASGRNHDNPIKSKLERWKQKAEVEINSITIEEQDKYNNITQMDNEQLEEEQRKCSYCPYCGNNIKTEQNKFMFCPNCGNKL
jgi:DNA-binding response OmpR family regulator